MRRGGANRGDANSVSVSRGSASREMRVDEFE